MSRNKNDDHRLSLACNVAPRLALASELFSRVSASLIPHSLFSLLFKIDQIRVTRIKKENDKKVS